MTPPTLSRQKVRQLDRRAMDEFGISGTVLMENAGRGVADTLCSLGITGPVVICCGRGNNPGDGFVLARHLDLRGYEVRVLLFADPESLNGDAAVNFHILEKTDVPIEYLDEENPGPRLDQRLAGAAWAIDGLLGTGARGEPRAPLDVVIDRINEAEVPTLALDLPSGLDCDTGRPATHTIRAAHTCTFAVAKPGLVLPQSAPYVGQLHVLDIGAPRKLLSEMLAEQAD